MKLKQTILVLSIAIFTFSCAEEKTGNENVNDSNMDKPKESTLADEKLSLIAEKDGIKIWKKNDSPEFENASIKLSNMELRGVNEENKPVLSVAYDVEDYMLGEQTMDKGHCANSDDGQHIHVILNNQPYLAKYGSEFPLIVDRGEYVCLSFLSRSYHESIKNPHAYSLSKFEVNDENQLTITKGGMNEAHMFYSRPKGTYTGSFAKHVLLDWYLVNCNLSEDGYKVKAIINGSEFIFTEWAPFIMEGLPIGEVSITLELIDSEGSRVDSPFNPVTRTILLQEEAL